VYLRFLSQSAKVPAGFLPVDNVRLRNPPEPGALTVATDTSTARYDLFAPPPHPTRAGAGAVKANTRAVISELRFGQLGIAQLTLRSVDPAAVWAELDGKVKAAPQLFTSAPLVLDLAQLPALPPVDTLRAVIVAIREAGMLPVGLVHATAQSDALARSLDLALFARLRTPVEVPTTRVEVTPSAATAIAATQTMPHPAGQHHTEPVRSGQQVYARGRDLTLTAMVGNGAEVIADGSIHVYSTLRGRALAGAQGDRNARIYCQNFQAELISIAGQYRVFEEMPAALRGKPVQAWLEDEKLMLAALK